MRFWFLFSMLVALACGDDLVHEKFVNPENCNSCHQEQFSAWKTSLHAFSHEENNELYARAVEFAATRSMQNYEKVLVGCGTCHNPRLDVKDVNDEYLVAKIFLGESKETQEVDNALKASHIKNGISCYVCHNVDSIKPKNSPTDVGYKIIDFIKTETIVGPFNDANERAASWHSSEARPFFTQGNDLCLVCHQGQANSNALALYNTGSEYAQSPNHNRRCVECHMSSLSNTILAAETEPEKAINRNTREHLFAGVRNNPELFKGAITATLDKENSTLNIKNEIPHDLPSGFSGRSMVMSVIYDNGSQQSFELRAKFVDKENSDTLAYVAERLVSDTRLLGGEERKFELEIPNNAKKITVKIVYYVLDPNLQAILQLKDEKFTKAYEVFNEEIEL